MTKLAYLPIVAIVLFVCLSDAGFAQLRKQIRGPDTPQPMSQTELNELGDPLFRLFLRDNPNETALAALEQAVQPDASKRRLFVVDEKIINPARPQGRRAVIAFEGTNQGIALKGNAMLSVVFSDTQFRGDAFIEGWGWDDNKGRYNYYRMDSGTWKFRGSSADASLFGESNTCFACHLNGAPIMKELLIPWNHWHSRSAEVPYFSRLQPPSQRWPIANDARFDNLGGAGSLDLMIRASIANFNSRRISDATDNNTLRNSRDLLKHLFQTTEFNMISASQESNLHPLATIAPSLPSSPVAIPNNFFLNSAIIGGGGFSNFRGLGIIEARSFQADQLKVQPAEYKDLVQDANLKINNQPGDTHFAWLIPEPSDIDNQMVEKLMADFIVPGHFVAAVMAIDLDVPILSEPRASLINFIPTEFVINSAAAAGDRFNEDWFQQHGLTTKTVAALEAANLTGNPAAAEFLALLKMTSGRTPLEELETRVQDYVADINAKLTGANRTGELKTLFKLAIKRRKDVLAHPLLGTLDETGGKLLFPESN